MLLAGNSWIELLLWFPAHTQLEDVLCGCLDSLVRLSSQARLGTVLSRRQGYDLAYLPLRD